jgi:hypothetical protein
MSPYVAPQHARCCAVTGDGEYCRRAPMRGAPPGVLDFLPSFIQLCRQHAAVAIGEFDAARNRKARDRHHAKTQKMRNSDVYYVQRSDGLIKIGYSSQLGSRLGSLRLAHGPLTLLATHKGGRPAEDAQHEQFREHRVVGEWFRPVPELLAHIARINARRSKSAP